MIKIRLFLFFTIVSIGIAAQETANPKDTLKVLFVGNSYTYYQNMPHVVSVISDSTNTKLITKKSTRGNTWLYQHWKGHHGLRTKEKILNGNFDIVVLQEYSMGAINRPDSLSKYVKLFADLIRSSGAKPYLFLVWAREKVPQYQAELDSIYTSVAKENKVTLVPIGKGWELARSHRTSDVLFQSDGTHPSPIGTFLTAAIFTGCLTGEVPEKVYQAPTIRDGNGESVELLRLDWLDMIFALKVAQETIDTYWR